MGSVAAFEYLARRGDGTRVRGTLHAASREEALGLMRERALVPVHVRPHREGGAILRRLGTRVRASERELVGFMHSFSTMVRAGVPLLRVLEVLEQEAPSRALQAAIMRMQGSLMRGEPLARAMERSGLLTPIQLAMLRTGEAGGILEEALERIARIVSREHALRRRISGALTYPVILGAATLVSIAFLIGTLTPALARFFSQMSVPLPATTRVLLATGGALHAPLAIAAAATCVAALVLGQRCLRRSTRAARAAERLALRSPLIGPLRRAVVVARVARTLAALLRIGLPTLETIELAAQCSGSPTAAGALRDLRRSLREGEGLAQRVVAGGFFPPLFVQMVRVGEECGTLDSLLDAVADFYEVESEAALHTLATLIEPVLIALLGGVVAAIALAVFVPLYSVIGSLR